MPEFMANVKKRTGTAARALEFLILTASRTNESVLPTVIPVPVIILAHVDEVAP